MVHRGGHRGRGASGAQAPLKFRKKRIKEKRKEKKRKKEKKKKEKKKKKKKKRNPAMLLKNINMYP